MCPAVALVTSSLRSLTALAVSEEMAALSGTAAHHASYMDTE